MRFLTVAVLVASFGTLAHGSVASATSIESADLVLTGGRIYTANPADPWAEAVAISDGRFSFVGKTRDALAYVGPETERYYLGGQLVVPGLIDAHGHAGLTGILGGSPEEGAPPPIPTNNIDSIIRWVERYARHNLILFGCCWPVDMFGIEGPRKELLDPAAPRSIVALFDDSGHSQWMNSLALAAIGATAETPDPAPGLSFFVRDPDGSPTGWVKEFAAAAITPPSLLLPGQATLERDLHRYLDRLEENGVMTLFDAGNLQYHDLIYETLARFDAEGRLPLRVEGSYHVFVPEGIDNAIEEVERMRMLYVGDFLQVNTIKIHFDGVLEIRTAAMLEPYNDDPENTGRTLFSAERITRLLLDMEGRGMNLHLHTVGAAAVRTALDAVESAREAVGGALDTRVALSHIELIAEEDIGRFKELDVIANFTPHWHGNYGEDVSEDFDLLGPDRAARQQPARLLEDSGAIVTYSSDTIDISELPRLSPFFGMQVGHTRQEPGLGADAPVMLQESYRLFIEHLLQGYTRNAAHQLRREDELGSIEAGKVADLLVLDQDLFEVDPYSIAETKPLASWIMGIANREVELCAGLSCMLRDVFDRGACRGSSFKPAEKRLREAARLLERAEEETGLRQRWLEKRAVRNLVVAKRLATRVAGKRASEPCREAIVQSVRAVRRSS